MCSRIGDRGRLTLALAEPATTISGLTMASAEHQPRTIFPATLMRILNANSDCTFTDSFSDETTATGVIVDGGREIDFIETYPGKTISGTAKKRVQGGD